MGILGFAFALRTSSSEEVSGHVTLLRTVIKFLFKDEKFVKIPGELKPSSYGAFTSS
jgi:hypothetical protein